MNIVISFYDQQKHHSCVLAICDYWQVHFALSRFQKKWDLTSREQRITKIIIFWFSENVVVSNRVMLEMQVMQHRISIMLIVAFKCQSNMERVWGKRGFNIAFSTATKLHNQLLAYTKVLVAAMSQNNKSTVRNQSSRTTSITSTT